MKQYETRHFRELSELALVDKINKAGRRGWKLVSVVYSVQSNYQIFMAFLSRRKPKDEVELVAAAEVHGL